MCVDFEEALRQQLETLYQVLLLGDERLSMARGMMNATSFLFVPALTAPRLLPKALGSAADIIVLDLEDAIEMDRKEEARAALSALDWHGAASERLAVRVNGHMSPDWEPDMSLVARLPVGAVMIPKVSDVSVLKSAGCLKAPSQKTIALLECARGIAEAGGIVGSGFVDRFAFGSLDFAADTGCGTSNLALAYARSVIVMASRLGGLPQPVDGVTPNFRDLSVTLEDARHSREMGFGGKLCIHPGQITAVHEAFAPSEDEMNWARKVLAADAGDGATSIDGVMVDAPIRARARRIIGTSIR
jgi:citrate lyase subunit beta / citryl-CoA lyase